MIKPHVLSPGQTIGIISPGSPGTLQDLQVSCDWWEERGYKTKLSPNLNKGSSYLAGTPEERANDLNAMFVDDEVDAIIPMRGGCGSAQIVNKINYSAFESCPKLFIGFSDNTTLHLSFAKHTEVITFHGPVFSYFADDKLSEYSQSQFFKAVSTNLPLGSISQVDPAKPFRVVAAGVAEAPLIGGNLSLLSASMGTPYEIDTDGRILFLEEVGCEPWLIITYLTHLRNAGKFDAVAGVVIAEGERIEPSSPNPTYQTNQSFESILADFFQDAKFPVLYGLPLGHTRDMATIPLRTMVKLDCYNRVLKILESGVT